MVNRVIHIRLTPIKTIIYLSFTIYSTSFYLKDCEIIGNDMNSYEGLSLYIIVHILPLLFNKSKSGFFLINQKEYDENIIPSNTTFVLFGGKT